MKPNIPSLIFQLESSLLLAKRALSQLHRELEMNEEEITETTEELFSFLDEEVANIKELIASNAPH